MSYSDQFADSFAVPGFITVLGGIAPSTYGHSITKAKIFVFHEHIRAPRIYVWAAIQTHNGLGAPIGPTEGWARNRDTVPTIYLPHPDDLGGATFRDEVASGTAIGVHNLRAQGNLPGVFKYTPEKGTVLPDGQHTITIEFTPSVIGYSPTTREFTVTIGSP